MENQQELLKTIKQTILSLYHRWGSKSEIGTLSVRGGDVKAWVTGRGFGVESSTDIWHSFVAEGVEEYPEGVMTITYYVNKGDPAWASDKLEKMALYFSSDDFVNKIEGSIRRLKAINKALQ